MQRIALTYVLGLLGILTFAAMAGTASDGHGITTPPSVAFHYGNEPPVNMLSEFDRIVVEADHVSSAQLSILRQYGGRVYAYVSVGELDPQRDGAPSLPKSAVLGVNHAWHSKIVNLAVPAWRHYLLDDVIAKLWQRGYRGLFLDTLDSYKAAVHTSADFAAQRHALVSLIKAIHTRYPGIHLLLNRGFAVLPKVHADVDGVVAESLFRGWNQTDKTYVAVPKQQRHALIEQLDKVRKKYHLPVTVIDYLPPAKRKAARADARRIAALGFTPWVTNAALDEMGVGRIEARPRKILMLYSESDPGAPADDISNSPINALAAMPLEYLGYVPVYHEMHQPLPTDTLKGRFAGIVTWFNGPVPNPQAYRTWLLKQMNAGVPVAILGNPGITLSGKLLARMELRAKGRVDTTTLRIKSHDDMLGFEGMRDAVPPNEGGYLPGRKDVQTHLLLCDSGRHCLSPVLTARWGGLALSPWIVQQAPMVNSVGGESFAGRQQRWLLNPFRFFRTALHLAPMPVVDATTENGNRIASAHIDGDGFVNRANMPGTPYAGKVIRDQILKRFDFPVTVSVIEGEVAPDGLYPKQSPRLEQIARSIFRLPNVEIASHTYSHPLAWLKIKPGMSSGKYNLPIPGYKFSFKRDIAGSVHYINTKLAPPGKRVKVLLWSGDAIPPLPAMQQVAKLGIAQMNGGNTIITQRHDSLANVSPMTRPVGPYHQVYAPDMNEEIYTNGYRGPYWGFKHVIQTFKLTDSPRRLKPMSIYFHFFSGTRLAAVHALQTVFEYVLSQPIMPMFESTYCAVVENFRHIGIAKTLDGAWLIFGADADRTLRLPKNRWPNLADSRGVVGVRDLPQGRYVALSGADKVRLVLQKNSPNKPWLESANGRVTSWQRNAHGFTLELQSRVPLRVKLADVEDACHVSAPGAKQRHLSDDKVALSYGDKRAGSVRVVCR